MTQRQRQKHTVATHRDIATASAYLASKKEDVAGKHAKDVCRMLLAEKNIALLPEKVKEICEVLDIPLKRYASRQSSIRKNRTRAVAKALRDLMEAIDYKVPEDIIEICKAKGSKE